MDCPKELCLRCAIISLWIRLRLPSCGPEVRIPSIPSMLFTLLSIAQYLYCEKDENKQKEVGFGPYLKTNYFKIED